MRSMMVRAALVVLAAALAPAARAQQPPAPAPQQNTLAPLVGDVAPDFTARGATRYGLLAEPVKLSDYRGKTVVLAFFFKARTRG